MAFKSPFINLLDFTETHNQHELNPLIAYQETIKHRSSEIAPQTPKSVKRSRLASESLPDVTPTVSRDSLASVDTDFLFHSAPTGLRQGSGRSPYNKEAEGTQSHLLEPVLPVPYFQSKHQNDTTDSVKNPLDFPDLNSQLASNGESQHQSESEKDEPSTSTPSVMFIRNFQKLSDRIKDSSKKFSKTVSLEDLI
ncbi:hypothetical protein P9112_008803 [Eukaryota sp. TZLM1-RC]